MAFVLIMIAPGLTAEQYDAVMQAAQGGALSDGEIFHVARPSDQGWYVVDPRVRHSQQVARRLARVSRHPNPGHRVRDGEDVDGPRLPPNGHLSHTPEAGDAGGCAHRAGDKLPVQLAPPLDCGLGEPGRHVLAE